MGYFYNEHLKPIKLNKVPVRWADMDLTYLQPTAYDKYVPCCPCRPLLSTGNHEGRSLAVGVSNRQLWECFLRTAGAL